MPFDRLRANGGKYTITRYLKAVPPTLPIRKRGTIKCNIVKLNITRKGERKHENILTKL
jgi:hypothetical protein